METGARFVVKGQVQGVGYRYFIMRHAQELGLGGYVRNMPRGDVEIVAEGERHRLEQLLDFAQAGPAFAHVEDVEVHWGERTGKYSRFEVHY